MQGLGDAKTRGHGDKAIRRWEDRIEEMRRSGDKEIREERVVLIALLLLAITRV
jgi:hypothetical protein